MKAVWRTHDILKCIHFDENYIYLFNKFIRCSICNNKTVLLWNTFFSSFTHSFRYRFSFKTHTHTHTERKLKIEIKTRTKNRMLAFNFNLFSFFDTSYLGCVYLRNLVCLFFSPFIELGVIHDGEIIICNYLKMF